MHKGNKFDAEELVKVINKLDFIKKWQLFQFIPSGKFGTLYKNLYEINDEEFLNYKDSVISNYKYLNKLQFKDYHMRSKAYMLVDNSGNAWIQGYEKDDNSYNNRVIIGNINVKNNWDNIINYIKKG